jgi:outer membrane protein OmpA-like peptidoglycan-associated protein
VKLNVLLPKRARPILIGLSAVLGLSACANLPSGNPNDRQNTHMGAAIGALGGAILGNTVAGQGKRTQGTVIGAVVGATLGGTIGHQMDRQEAELREQMRNTGVGVEREGDTLRLVAAESITFDTGASVIKPPFRPVLDRVAQSVLNYRGTVLQIQGHTDNVGREDYNQRLSEQRANSVRGYMAQRGVPSTRMQALGYGLSQPVSSNQTAAGRAMNRRVEILIVPLP